MRIRRRRSPARRRWIASLSLAAFAVTFTAPHLARAQPPALLPVVQAMSTRQKVVLLAGAAALYWLYKRHQNAQGAGPAGRYYRSRNGRIYYRDPRTHQAIWVTPPPTSQPLAVPADEYERVTGQAPPASETGGMNRVITALPMAAAGAAGAAATPQRPAMAGPAAPAAPVPPRQGLTPRQKVLLLAGAAALYWLYKRHQNAQGEGPQGRYYRSKNGRIYYRDPRTHQAIWVTPPPTSQPIAVPADEYQRVVGQLPPGVTPAGGTAQVITQPLAPPGPPGP